MQTISPNQSLNYLLKAMNNTFYLLCNLCILYVCSVFFLSFVDYDKIFFPKKNVGLLSIDKDNDNNNLVLLFIYRFSNSVRIHYKKCSSLDSTMVTILNDVLFYNTIIIFDIEYEYALHVPYFYV